MRELLASLAAATLLLAACGGDDDASPTLSNGATESQTGTPSLTTPATGESPTATQCAFFPLDIYRLEVSSGFTTTVAHGLNGRWSPNGSYFGYTVPPGSQACDQGLTIDAAISHQRQFTVPGNIADWAWSPSSAAIAVAVADPGDPQPTDGASIVFLPTGAASRFADGQVGDVEWAPDGHAIAYSKAGTSEVFIYEFASLQTTTLPALLPDGGIRSVAWSPAGDRLAVIAFESDAKDNPIAHHLYFISLPAGATTEIFSSPDFITALEWAPDGSALLFEVSPSNAGDIYIAPIGAGAPEKIAEGLQASFSPDGSLIAYVKDWCGTFDIAVVAPDGTSNLVVAEATQGVQLNPTWSPDGANIAFLADAVYFVHPDGAGLTRAADRMESLAFSPDGRFLTGQSIGGRGFCE